MNLERFTAVFGNPWLTLVLGGLIGFALCWSSMVRPLKVHLDEREGVTRTSRVLACFISMGYVTC
jgi:hypothetical protein